MNVSHLNDLPLLDKLSTMWIQEEAHHLRLNTNPETLLIKNTQHMLRITRTYGKRKAKEKYEQERVLRETLAQAHLACEASPLDPTCLGKLSNAETAITDFDAAQAAWELDILQVHKIRGEDRCNKKMFSSFKARSKSMEIPVLTNTAGELLTTWDDQAVEAARHFTNLLSTRTPLDPDALNALLADQSKFLSPEARASLEAPLSLDELKKAAFSMARKKAPRPDGVPVELYLKLWEII